MKAVYLDTSGLYAAIVAGEERHEAAKACLDQLLARDVDLLLNSYVLLETMTLLHARVGLNAALAFERDLRPVLTVLWLDEAMHRQSVQRWQQRRGRKVSLTDCSSFVTMEQLGLTHVLGYDKHFADEGFALIESLDAL